MSRTKNRDNHPSPTIPELVQRIEGLEQYVAQLEEQNRLLKSYLFGRSSEKEKISPCGHPMKRIGEEVTERLCIKPAEIFVRQIVRAKYAPDCQCAREIGAPGEVKIAPMPPQIIPRGIATPELVAHVVTAKFVAGIPLFRQETQFKRLRLEITRGTMVSHNMASIERLPL